MIDAYSAAKDAGLRKIRLGNLHVFVHTCEEYERVEKCWTRKSVKPPFIKMFRCPHHFSRAIRFHARHYRCCATRRAKLRSNFE